MRGFARDLLWTALGMALAASAQAQISEEEDLAQAYGDKSFVSIATGARLPVSRAPAVATVITAEDIAMTGATDLDEALEMVPGLHVARSTLGYMPIYVIRGVHRDTNPQVLMLVNGIPLTSVFAGNRGFIWGGLPLENVARIEVIRGPGSALYGADAFSGVINIITKTATDIDGTQVGVRAGSFRTGDGWMLHGGKAGPVNIAAYLRVGSTEGDTQTVRVDGQTGWDKVVFGTHASRAPGPMNIGRDAVDGSLDLSYDQWRLRLGYTERNNAGTGSGAASALDPGGDSYSQRITTDLTWQDVNLARNWDLAVQGSYMHYKEFSDLTLYPAGAFGGAFADGFIGNPYKWEQHGRLTAAASYTGFAQHRVRLGTGFQKEEIYRVRETKNYFSNPAPPPPFLPIGTGSKADVTDVSDSAPFLRPTDRIVRYVYAQDEWNLAKDWTLTAGLRYDRYSDVGGTTNPRLALVWEAAYNLTAKLMYGSAFRAPSFTELYNANNPVVIGNPDLTPEKMKTIEAALSWEPKAGLQLGLNVFHYQMSDIISLVNTQYENTGKQTGNGLEFEATWEATKTLRLTGNCSYQRSLDDSSDTDAGLAPRHRFYVDADWRFAPGWAVNGQLNVVGSRYRVEGDYRDSLDGYETFDLTLRTTGGRMKGWDFTVSVRNLFDADAREPSPFDQSPTQPFISLPDDFPLPGRSFFAQARYRL